MLKLLVKAQTFKMDIAERIRRLREEDDGATLVEYALLVALIAIAAIVGISFLGNEISNIFNLIGQNLASQDIVTN